jgi:hypothetical protein
MESLGSYERAGTFGINQVELAEKEYAHVFG